MAHHMKMRVLLQEGTEMLQRIVDESDKCARVETMKISVGKSKVMVKKE